MQRIFNRWLLAAPLFVLLLFAQQGALALAASPAKHVWQPLTFVHNIPIPGAPPQHWFRDVAATSDGQYYLSDPSQFQVDQVDIQSGQFVRAIGHGLFNGPGDSINFDFARQSPEGVLAFQGKLWVSNVFVDSSNVGHSQVLVFDQASGALITTISTGGQQRSDEMTVMPNLNLLVVTNPDETFNAKPGLPYVSFIDTTTYAVVAQLTFPNASPGVSGLQQPEWIGGNKVDVLLPSPVGNPNGGEIDTIVVQDNGVTVQPFVPLGPAGHHAFPQKVNCQPAGMDLDFHTGLAAIGCGFFDSAGDGSQLIYNFVTNEFVAVLHGIQGVDIVATIPSTHGKGELFLFPSYISNVMYVTDAKGNVLQQITTSDLAHTVNFDPSSGEVFVPTGGGVVAVYSVAN